MNTSRVLWAGFWCAILYCYLFAFVGGAQVASDRPVETAASGPLPLTSIRALLLMIRNHPELATEQAIATFAVRQIQREQEMWRTTEPMTGTPPPLVVYEWQKYLASDPDLARGALLDTFLRQDADWSFAKRDPRWVERTNTRVKVFLFSRESVEGRPAEFAARELAPVLRRHLEMAIARTPNNLYVTTRLPRFAYDFDSGAIRFLAESSELSHGQYKSGQYTFAETVDMLIPIQQARLAVPMPASAGANASYFFDNATATEPPSTQPGGDRYAPTAAWRSTFGVGSSDTTFPMSVLVLSLDRSLSISSFPLDPAHAEQLVKMDAVMNRGGGGLRARIYFHADRVEPGERAYGPTRGKLGFGILFAGLDKVEILGKQDEVVATLAARAFPAPASAPPPRAAARPVAPTAQSGTPGDAPTAFTNMAGFSVELPAGWRARGQAFSSQDGRQSFRGDATGESALSMIHEFEKDARYQSFEHPQGRVFFRTFALPGRQYPAHDFLLELDGRGWRFACTGPTDLCLTIARSARYSTPSPRTGQARSPVPNAAGTTRSNGGAPAPQPPVPGSPAPVTPPQAAPRPVAPATAPQQVNAQASSTSANPTAGATASVRSPQAQQANVRSATPEELPSSKLASDPRLADLTPENRKFALDEADGSLGYCRTNMTLSVVYECGCFARRIFEARLRAGFKMVQAFGGQMVIFPQTEGLIMDMTTGKNDIGECISPSNLESYGRETSQLLMRGAVIYRDYSVERKEKISACVGRTLAVSYQARPVPDMRYLSDLVIKAIRSCDQ